MNISNLANPFEVKFKAHLNIGVADVLSNSQKLSSIVLFCYLNIPKVSKAKKQRQENEESLPIALESVQLSTTRK